MGTFPKSEDARIKSKPTLADVEVGAELWFRSFLELPLNVKSPINRRSKVDVKDGAVRDGALANWICDGVANWCHCFGRIFSSQATNAVCVVV